MLLLCMQNGTAQLKLVQQYVHNTFNNVKDSAWICGQTRVTVACNLWDVLHTLCNVPAAAAVFQAKQGLLLIKVDQL